MILLDGFNAKSKLWSVNGTTTEEGAILENPACLYEIKQLISAQIHTTFIKLYFCKTAKLSYRF